MIQSATTKRLIVRLAVCQAAGTILGLLLAVIIGALFGPPIRPMMESYFNDLLVIMIFALLVFGIPLFAATALILGTFTKSILERPLIWCVLAPGVILAAALYVFQPPEARGVHWIVLIPLCAIFAGLAFSWWQAKSPLVYVR